jgi:hypothetical protein
VAKPNYAQRDCFNSHRACVPDRHTRLFYANSGIVDQRAGGSKLDKLKAGAFGESLLGVSGAAGCPLGVAPEEYSALLGGVAAKQR